MDSAITKLLQSEEPSIRFRTLVDVLGRKPGAGEAKKLRQAIPASDRVQLLLSERDSKGRIPFHPYKKWYGAHWALASLADIG